MKQRLLRSFARVVSPARSEELSSPGTGGFPAFKFGSRFNGAGHYSSRINFRSKTVSNGWRGNA